MKSIFKITFLSALVLSVAACGGDGKKDNKSFKIQESGLSDGTYFLGAATVEGTNADGSRLDRQTLQVVGEYSWKTKQLGGNKYRLTATGTAKLLLNNQLVTEFICSGARDVTQFKLASGRVTNMRVLESGCPAGFNVEGAQQMTVEKVDNDAFIFNFVETGDGARYFVTFTFNKE